MKVALRLLKDLLGDTGGNMLPIGAAGLFVLLALIGSGVDMSRAYRAEQRLQAACDSAVLAGRRTVTNGAFDAASENAADAYFRTNFDEARQEAHNTRFTAESDDNGNTIAGSASTKVNSTVMQVFGFHEFDLSVDCSASMGVGNSDVTMVLDTTGSMNSTLSGSSQTRIQALRQAMTNFYDTVDTATSAGNARIRYALVPYSSSVNVGQLLMDLNPDYIADSMVIQSRMPIFTMVTNQVLDHWDNPVTTYGADVSAVTYTNWVNHNSTQYSNLSTCTAAKPANTAWANNGSSVTTTDGPNGTVNGLGQQVITTTVAQPQIATFYRCAVSGSKYRLQRQTGTRTANNYIYATSNPVYRSETSQQFDYMSYQQVNFNTSAYKNFETVSVPTAADGSMQSFLWGGCVEERDTVNNASFSYSSITGITPSGAIDLDIDTAPDTSNDGTKWKPLWQGVAYYRTTSASGSTPTSATTSRYGRLASSACPANAQLLREMSADEFDAYAQSLVAGGNTYHDIGMIWGGRLSSPDGMWGPLVNEDPMNGGEVSRHLIFMTDGIMEPNSYVQSSYGIEWQDRRTTTNGVSSVSRHNSRFLAVCDEVRAKGIRVWVIAFSSSLTTELQTCASPGSSFLANDAAQLNDAFQEIAKQVGELRIVQ